MKVTKECHSQACLAQRWRVFLRERSLTKFSPGLFFNTLAGALEKREIQSPSAICTHTVTPTCSSQF